ncbi:phytanoyl-CoA dioxygenase family protein [Streptomyces sp. 7N604]|uniref:phytanoyl-CoA dioxygenase family protein n=1 Tax=Streptomyces sp. 7N604 TaxID=3457415 RepID=UPI003FD144FC
MLTQDQIDAFDKHGYVMLPDLFSPEELAAMDAEILRLKQLDHPQRLLEVESNLVRAIYGLETSSEVLERLTRDPRVATPAQQVLRSKVYLYQTQVSPKMAFRSAAWEWHQDFMYWCREDGMPTPNAVSIAIHLDDVTEFNGPLYIVAGSHTWDLEQVTAQQGDGWEGSARSGDKYKISDESLSQLIDESKLVSVKAPRGTAVIFHSGLLHCSPPNLSPRDRTVLFVRYNAVDNALRPVPEPRPEWLAPRHNMAISPSESTFLSSASH